jgi:hypothetical protein
MLLHFRGNGNGRAGYPATIKQGGCKPPFDGWLALEFAPHRLRVAYGDIVMLTGNLTLTG